MNRFFLLIFILFSIVPSFTLASKPLVSVDWLKNKLATDNLIILDIRNKIDNGGIEVFLKGHIPGSLHSDYIKDGWRVKRNNVIGLLPSEEEYIKLVNNLGINNEDHIVIVPAGVSSTDFGSAARVYWTFKVYGHKNLSILDGGYAKWKSNYPNLIEINNLNRLPKSNYIVDYNKSITINSEDVYDIIKNGNSLLLDARTQLQWRGKEKHPASVKPGRLPNSIFKPQEENYDKLSNKLKNISELKDIYKDIDEIPIVSYCNTGHWAATNWFVLSELLKKSNVKLYDGSMVEWSKNPNLPIVTEINKIDDFKYWFKSILNKI